MAEATDKLTKWQRRGEAEGRSMKLSTGGRCANLSSVSLPTCDAVVPEPRGADPDQTNSAGRLARRAAHVLLLMAMTHGGQ